MVLPILFRAVTSQRAYLVETDADYGQPPLRCEVESGQNACEMVGICLAHASAFLY